jgi:mono/diheme cytochrome c family protein
MANSKRIFRIVFLAIGALVVLAALFVGYIHFGAGQMMDKSYAHVQRQPIDVPTDSASIREGQRLANINGCTNCHGAGLEGRVIISPDSTPLGMFAAPNLTHGQGGLGDSLSTLQWVRLLHDGIKRNGKGARLMPAHQTSYLPAKQLGQIIAFVRSRPPVNGSQPEIKTTLLSKALLLFNQFPFDARHIDHQAPLPESLGTTPLERGKVLSHACSGCHRENLAGGNGVEPGSPAIPAINAGSRIAKGGLEVFKNAIRNGKAPAGGRLLVARYMPWPYMKYTDEELSDLYAYLSQVQAKE